mgnify:FL=1
MPPFKITRLVNFRQPISHRQNGLAQMRIGLAHGLSHQDYDQDDKGKANSYSLGSPRKAVADNVCLVRPVTGRLFSTLKISSY